MSPPLLHLAQQADTADEIDRAVRDVLAEPPYVDEPNLVERLVQWVLERLGGGVGGGGLDALAWVVRGIVYAGIAAVLGFVVWLVWRRVGMGAFRRGPGRAATTTSVGDVDRSAADWLAEGRAAVAEGRHRDAVRAAYRAVVVHLVDLRAVPAMAGATVGAHRAAMRDTDVVAAMQARGFDRASDVFERVWYADGEATRDDAEVVLAAAEDLGVGR